MKQLKFDHIFAQAIQSGVRNTTLRVDNKGIRVGDRVQLVDKVDVDSPDSWVITGELEITSVQEFYVGDIPKQLFEIAEISSRSSDALMVFLRRFYGDTVNGDTIVTLLEFRFTPYKKSLAYENNQTTGAEIGNHVKLFADGGSRGNPGPSAYGFVLKNLNDLVIFSGNKYLGVTTNNQAEYHGLLAGLEWCADNNISEVEVYLDSLLVVNQMNRVFKVKNRELWSLYETAKKISERFVRVTFTHIPRELNKHADAEVNKALDAVKGEDVVQ